MNWSKFLTLRSYFPWVVFFSINVILLVYVWVNGLWLYHPDGTVWTHDYLALWAAGHRVWAGEADLIYDWKSHGEFQALLIGASQPTKLYFFYPPHFLFTTTLFAWLDFIPAALTFLCVTAVGYAASINLIVGSWKKSILIALSGGGAFYSLWYVQNGFLTAALLTAGLVLLKNRPIAAGIFFGCLTIKPQLGLLIPIALIAGGHWRTILSATATLLILASFSEILIGPGIWNSFITSISETSQFLQDGNNRFKQQSIFSLALLFFSPKVAWICYGIMTSIVMFTVVRLWRSRSAAYWTKCSALISGSLLVAPYIYTYDAVMLTASAAMLLEMRAHKRMSVTWQMVIFICCLLPLASRFFYSATVPMSALILLFLALYFSDFDRQPETVADT